ncbi:MAG: hypothetical protein JWM87_4061, partial [Candidatus Eremiobacteraeota bacterium]|nr:hypothetical protein [Candidatus Eremiobacteraeota bacterium]
RTAPAQQPVVAAAPVQPPAAAPVAAATPLPRAVAPSGVTVIELDRIGSGTARP